jgi:16S rRNA C967 or C1407 C5-methylase (RsmB/RsmF family)
MHQDFTQYIHSTFFVHDPEGFEAFQQALHKPLKKTIRINTKRSSIDSWKQEHDTWTLQSTRNARVFAVDRPENERYLAL